MPCGFHVNEWFKIWTCNSVSNPDGMPEWCHNWISRASLHLCHPGLACSSDIDRHQRWPLHKVAIGQVIVELSRECARSLDVCSVPGRLHTGETLPGWWSHSFLQTGLYCWFLCFLSSQETCTALPPHTEEAPFLFGVFTAPPCLTSSDPHQFLAPPHTVLFQNTNGPQHLIGHVNTDRFSFLCSA